MPPRMDDGRHFTDYRPNYYLNSEARIENGISSGCDYRSFLTHNAVKLMNMNSQSAWKRNGCGPCKNLCLGIDESKRPGNSTIFDTNSCIPPAEFFKYVGTDGTSEASFTRATVPSGFILPEPARGWNCCDN
tara:strand:+ start:12821 stop:13216 length:396 start_codon:yes stop_codon:yes gene_type:complete